MSYIQRQSRVPRSRKSTTMAPILEHPEQEPKNSVKAKRRHGVSDLRVPPLDLLGWRLTLPLDEEDGTEGVEIFDFPPPPSVTVSPRSSHERQSSDESSESSRSDWSTPATTPASSPTADTHAVSPSPKRIVRCKTIKPLTITKRTTKSLPPLPRPVVETQADDDFYASMARNFITLSPPLPPSFPTSKERRESIVVTAPTPSLSRSSSASSSASRNAPVPNFSRPTSLSRTANPPAAEAHETVWSGDFAAYYSAYAPLITSNAVTDASSTSSSKSVSSSRPLPRLLTPPPTPSPAKVPSDIEADEWEWECEAEDTDASLSPIVAPNPDLDSAFEDDLAEPRRTSVKPPPYTGWHPRPRTSQLRREIADLLPSHQLSNPAPVLRSRWSSSTLSSVRSAGPRSPPAASSPKTFAFARRYFPRASAKPAANSSTTAKPKPRPGDASKRKAKARITVDDVRVVRPGSVVSPESSTTTRHSRHDSASGQSACSSHAGAWRKPIPVDMFAR